MLLHSLKHRVTRPVPSGDRPGGINLLFAVEKPRGVGGGVKFRWVLDMSRWGEMLGVPSSRMGGEAPLCETLQQGMWVAPSDFRGAFWLLNMAAAFAAMQRFYGPAPRDRGGTADAGPPAIKEQVVDQVGRRLWGMPVCAMGTGPPPARFSEHPKMVARGVADFQMQASTYTGGVAAISSCRVWCYLTMMVLAVAPHLLGPMMSWGGFMWKPMQVADYIGFRWGLARFKRSLTPKRLRDIAETAKEAGGAAGSGTVVVLKLISRVEGQVMAGVGGCRKLALKAGGLREWHRRQLALNGQNHDARVIICPPPTPMFVYLQNIPVADNWEYIRRRPPTLMFPVDASEYAWCCHLVPMAGPGGKVMMHFPPAGQRGLHHNQHEDLGRIRGLGHFIELKDLRGTGLEPPAIGCETGNQVVLKSWGRQKTKSLLIAARVGGFRDYFDHRYLQLHMSPRPGKFMQFRRQTDPGSRGISKWFNWRLRRAQREWILECFLLRGGCMVDLFAEQVTAQFPRFVSRAFHPGALWGGALAQPWSAAKNQHLRGDEVLWIFPPPKLIPKVISKLATGQQDRLPAVLLVPNTPRVLWHQRLMELWPNAARVELPLWKVACQPLGGGKVKVGKLATPPDWRILAIRL